MLSGQERSKNLLIDLYEAVLDLVYPPKCLICDEMQPQYICNDCLKEIVYIKTPICARCGAPIEDKWCQDCHQTEFAFDSAKAVGEYDGVLRQAIHLLKYSGHKVLTPILGELMVDYLHSERRFLNRIGCIVPMPIHISRLKQRGFNQSELLAKEIGNKLALPVNTSAVIRSKATKSQVGMQHIMRQENVEDAFEVVRPDAVYGRVVLLVDDVLTTGSTADSAARAIREAGAAEVHVLTLARAI